MTELESRCGNDELRVQSLSTIYQLEFHCAAYDGDNDIFVTVNAMIIGLGEFSHI